MLHLKRWLTPPIFPADALKTQRASVLSATLITTMALAAIILVGNLLGRRTPTAVIVVDLAAILACVILRRWLYQGRINLASAVLIGLDLAGTTLFVALLGTIRTPTTAAYLLIVVGSGLLFDISGILLSTALSSLAVLGLIIAENAGWLPRPDYAVTITQWIAYTALFGLSGGLTWSALQSTRQALRRAGTELIERQQAERELARQSQRYRLFMQTSRDAIHLLDKQGVLREWNDAFLSHLGYTADEARTLTVVDWDVQWDRLTLLQRITEVIEQNRTFETRHRRKDGSIRDVEISASSLVLDGEVLLYAAARDITDRKRLEEILRDSEARYRAVVEDQTEIICRFRQDNVYTFVNDVYCRFFGKTRDELLGRAWEPEVVAEDRPGVEAKLRNLTPDNPVVGHENRVYSSTGEIRWMQFVNRGFFNMAGNLVEVQAVGRDITERKRMEEALQQSETLYHTLVETLPLNIFRKDAAGRFTFANTLYCRTQGRALNDILGKTDYDLHPRELAEKYRADDERLMAAGRTFETVEEHQPIDGPKTYVQVVKTPIYAHAGQAIGIQGAFWDVTDRNQAEEALRVSEERYRSLYAAERRLVQELALLDQARTALAREIDLPNVIRTVVEAIAHTFGYTQVSLYLIQDNTLVLQHQVGYSNVISRIPLTQGVTGRVARTGQPILLQNVANDAEFLAAIDSIVSEVCTPLIDQGQVAGILNVESSAGVSLTEVDLRLMMALSEHISIAIAHARLYAQVRRELAERQRAEADLRRLKDFNEGIVQTMSEGIVIEDLQGRFTYLNPAATTLLGYPAEELLGQHWTAVIPADQWPKVKAADTRRAAGTADRYELDALRKNGTRISLLVSGSPWHEDGRYAGSLVTFADITERKQAEEALRELNRGLEQRVAERTRELTDAYVRLTELDRLKDDFISRISHELRTPLTNIKIYLELLERGKPEKYEQYMHILHDEANKLHRQIGDLLEVSHLQSANLEPELAPFDVSQLVQDLYAEHLAKAQARGLSLTITTTPAQADVVTDRVLIAHALSRLVANALAYTPSGGAVTLSTARHTEDDQTWVTIEVRDTGPGISAQDLPSIFEPFYRGQAANDYKTPGAGVGLSIARRTIQQLGGRITVDTQLGRGSAFTIWLRA